ncbi:MULTISPECIES: histidine phosphatase family protein [unclassified Mesotoga]|jgi:broad specificity phosphatase PhoE|uniref:histidine phosphatase family protein n=1 Tax=unclassified Mesotoga TaxID=1184398 RepID=UPI000ADC7561|nr:MULTISPECIES: histidine phosphatase family protein [unclassified Mesotoga]
MTTIYLMRHGQSQANVEGIFANGDNGFPLTDEGRIQAKMAARYLKLRNIRKIYTSPILRARETSRIVSSDLEIEPQLLDEIREFHVGELEGQLIEGEAERAFLELVRSWIDGKIDKRIPNGESHREVIDRFWKAMNTVVSECPEGEALMVSHGGFLSMTLPFVCNGIDPKRFFSRSGISINNCAITTVKAYRRNDSFSLELVDWANTSHMELDFEKEPVETIWNSED